VIYGVLDIEFDRRSGVHSIPADLGIRGAVWATGILFGLSVIALGLVAVWFDRRTHEPLAWPYLVALCIVAVMLVNQHVQLRRFRDARVLDAFNANMVVGPLMLVGAVLGLMLR